ncbi:MAG: NUDIX domain-containing protein [bacterium]|nr:NUDIX domain-containing protein [bacterium]
MEIKQAEKFEYFMVGQKSALIRDGKCLIVESAAMPGFWELPGGRINKGEFKEPALRREIKEEIGLNEFDILGIVDYDIFYNKDANAAFCVTVHLIKNDLDEIILSDESLQYKWITETEIGDYNYYRGFYSELIKKSFKLHKFLADNNQ